MDEIYILVISIFIFIFIVILQFFIYRRLLKRKESIYKVLQQTDREKVEDINKGLDDYGFYFENYADIISSKMYCWQREMGYCKLYDDLATSLNMIIDCEPKYFQEINNYNKFRVFIKLFTPIQRKRRKKIMSTYKRLSEVYKSSNIIPYDSCSKFVIMSDCHRGTGNSGDNFLKNQHIFLAALGYYYDEGFTYIELGDGDELWENRCMQKIIEIHTRSFNLMYKLYDDDRMYMIFGNHDKEKKDDIFTKCNLTEYYCEYSKINRPIFPGIEIHEGLILENKNNKNHRIFLVHGHQGDLINDRLYKVGRFLVRYFWRVLEMWGVNDPTDAGKNYKKKNRVERKLAQWSREEDVMLISGHTHRPTFACIGKPMYFNDGSCIHPECITAIEIEKGYISLVKWSTMIREDRSMYVEREILEGPAKLEDYFEHNKITEQV